MKDLPRTWVELSPATLLANLQHLQSHLGPDTRLMAVVKANAYGHHAQLLVPHLTRHVDAFGVANVHEATQLREWGVRNPIHILSPLLPGEEEGALAADAIPLLCTEGEVRRLAAAAHGGDRRSPIHLMVDTGMGRAGSDPETITSDFLNTLTGTPEIHLTGVATHFACADEPDAEHTLEQLATFQRFLAQAALPSLCRHAANSAALLRFPDTHFDLVRPGLALYGVSHLPDGAGPPPLEPVLTWKTHVLRLRSMPAGGTLSYGATVRLQRPARIALLPVGYADGYPWAASNRAQVLVRGRRASVVGRVCMDLTLVDVTGLPVAAGDEVVLVGRQKNDCITASELARWAGTIPYEILTNLGPRAARRVVGDE